MENKFNGICIVIASIIIAAAIIWHSEVGRYLPVSGQAPGTKIDTTTGAIFH